MGLEKAGKMTVSNSGKGFVITLENRVIIQRYCVSRQDLKELDAGRRVWIQVFQIVGDNV